MNSPSTTSASSASTGKLQLPRHEPPWRQVHLDFHTAPDISGVGAEFDAKEFAETLHRAQVNSCTVFSRCHHGNMYYDSKAFPGLVHPGLAKKNLLETQVAALHKRDIRAPVYTTVQWDYRSFMEHPEWRVLTTAGGAKGWEPLKAGFYGYLCVNTGYRDFLKAHVRDLHSCVPDLDGLFFDIVWRHECVCPDCLQLMQAYGLDPICAADRSEMSSRTVIDFVRDMSSFVHDLKADATIYYNSADLNPGFRDHADAFTHLEFDILPSQHVDGYMQFPTRSRFERNLSACVGMTGKFHGTWGDLHSLKGAPALTFECAQLMSLGVRISIGDQMPPSGKLDAPSYGLIGPEYARVAACEPWLKDAVPVTDIAVIQRSDAELKGPQLAATRLLQELGHQFDFIDPEMELDGYLVVILPDRLWLTPALAERLKAFVKKGGRILATFESGMNEKRDTFLFDELGVTLQSQGPVNEDGILMRGTCRGYGMPPGGNSYGYADFLKPYGTFAPEIHRGEHMMYAAGMDVSAAKDAVTLAHLVRPIYYRSYRHFFSHRQGPAQNTPHGAAVVETKAGIYCAFPLFEIFNIEGAPWVKKILASILDRLLPEPLIRKSAPPAVTVTVNDQPSENRMVVHLLNFIPERKAELREVVEEPIPMTNTSYSLRLDGKAVSRVRLVPENKDIPFESGANRVTFTVPLLCGHQMVEISWSK